MARLLEETLVVRFSRIVRSDDKQTPVITEELRSQFLELLGELFNEDKSLIVELGDKVKEPVYRGAEPDPNVSTETPQPSGRRTRGSGTADKSEPLSA